MKRYVFCISLFLKLSFLSIINVFICLVLSLSTTDMLLFLTYGLYYVSASFKVVAKKSWAMNSWNLMFCRPQAVKDR